MSTNITRKSTNKKTYWEMYLFGILAKWHKIFHIVEIAKWSKYNIGDILLCRCVMCCCCCCWPARSVDWLAERGHQNIGKQCTVNRANHWTWIKTKSLFIVCLHGKKKKYLRSGCFGLHMNVINWRGVKR